jgi:hypothetical protein
LEYLFGWAKALHGRSGFSEFGVAPLSYATVEAWSRLMDVRVDPHEVEALMALDAVMCHPGENEPSEDKPRSAPAWPTKKAG